MHHSLSHFLNDLFPELGHPAYQTATEIVSFLLVSMMLIGALFGAVVLLLYGL
ncbi:MAG TPA: hypothetical protein VH583_01200 [Vicinamibacterales bacterium]|jgi:hypothetical protein